MTRPDFDDYRARMAERDFRQEAFMGGYEGEWAAAWATFDEEGEEAVPDNPDWAPMTPAEILEHEFGPENKCDDCCPVPGCEVCGPCERHDGDPPGSWNKP